MNHVEIFYFDVDGTLFDNHTHQIYESTKKALKKLKELGYKVALCTGRPPSDLGNVKDLIEWDGYVLSNGSLIFDENFNLIHENAFERDFIIDFIKESSGPLLIEGHQSYLTSEPHEKVKESLSHFNIVHNIEVIDFEQSDVSAYNLICYDMDSLSPEFTERLYKECIVVADLLGNGEIIHRGSGKHNGCKHLNKHLNVTNFVGFGDGENDINFLKAATYSVAMGNATDIVKEAADYITDRIEQDGILNALIKHHIIEEGTI